MNSSSNKFKALVVTAPGVLVVFALFAAVRSQTPTDRRRPLANSEGEIIFATRFSPDSRTLAISRGERDDNRVELWDTLSGSLKHSIKGFDGPVWSVSFAPDGKTLVTGSSGIHSQALQDSRKHLGKRFVELKWWDTQTGDLKKRLELPGDDRLRLLALHSPNGKLLATAEYRLPDINYDSSRPLARTTRGEPFPRAYLPILSYHTEYKLLEAVSGEVELKFKQSMNGVGAELPVDPSSSDHYSNYIAAQIRQPLIFSPDGQLVASWNSSEIRLWSTESGEDVRKLKDFHGRLVSAAFSPDGRSMAIGILKVVFKKNQIIYSSELQICDLSTGTIIATLPLNTHAITNLAFAGNGRQVLVSGLHKEAEGSFACLELVDIKDGTVGSLISKQQGAISSLTLSPDGALVAFQIDASTVKLLDTQNWRTRSTFGQSDDANSDTGAFKRYVVSVKSVLSVAFLPDGKTVAGQVEQGGVKLWDLRTGEMKTQVAQADDSGSADISADGTTFAEALGDNAVRLWNLAHGDQATFPSGGAISVLDLSGDGTTLAIVLPGRIAILDSNNGKIKTALKGIDGTIKCLALSSDGRILAAADEAGTLKVWNTEQGNVIKTFMAGDEVSVLRFAPGNRMLASGNKAGHVSLWDLQAGGAATDLKKHNAVVNAIAFSADGKLMATGSDDRTAIVWDPTSGKSLRTLKGHDLAVTALAFSPDQSLLAAGSGNASVVLWDWRAGKLDRVLH